MLDTFTLLPARSSLLEATLSSLGLRPRFVGLQSSLHAGIAKPKQLPPCEPLSLIDRAKHAQSGKARFSLLDGPHRPQGKRTARHHAFVDL